MPSSSPLPSLLSFTLNELEHRLEELHLPRYLAKQVLSLGDEKISMQL